MEIIFFGILGLFCGLGSFCFVTLQRNIVLFNRRNTKFHVILQRHPLVYPVIVTSLIALVSFPPALGQYYASWLSSEQAMHELFSNKTWGGVEYDEEDDVIDNWRTESTSIYTNTFLFFVMNLVTVALASTMPVPLGLIVPSFKIGAGLGRFYGEGMAYMFPEGINPYGNRTDYPLIAGAYAVAGSAAFAGGTTGALSSAVIAFEMTGQLTHLLPIIVAVLVSNLVAQYLGPSIYDSLIKLKKLPYLPAIISTSSAAHRIFVEDFMKKDLQYVYQGCSYRYLRHLLNSDKHAHVYQYPFVKSPESMILLGTVERAELESLLEDFLNKDKLRAMRHSRPPRSLPSNPPRPGGTTCPVHGERPVSVVIPEDDVVDDEQESAVSSLRVSAHRPIFLRRLRNASHSPSSSHEKHLGLHSARLPSLIGSLPSHSSSPFPASLPAAARLVLEVLSSHFESRLHHSSLFLLAGLV